MIKIPTLKLNSRQKMPAFGFGTWNLDEGAEVIGAVSEALDVGYRLLDTAKVYRNEEGVGRAIRRSSVPRKEIFVTTKLWVGQLGYENALEEFEESLERLGLEYIDLYLIHWPGNDSRLREEAWRALVDIHKKGMSKSIGVSNYTAEHLKELLKSSDVVPAVNQIEFHPYLYEKQEPVLKFCKKHGIAVEAYSPLSGGHGLSSITVNDVAEQTGRTPAQVVLRWAIQHGTIPIPKSAHAERMKENIDVFDFKLSTDDMKRLDDLSRSTSFL